MPCSSSETGTGSNWESCCSALTAFLSAPPATSSRTEVLLNSGSRSHTRGSRGIGRGSGIGSRVLFPTFAPPLSAFDDGLSSSAPAVSTAARSPSLRDNGEGSTHEEVPRTPYDDVGRDEWAPFSSTLALGDAAAVQHPSSPDHSDGSGLGVRPEQQELRVYPCAGAVVATAARAAASYWPPGSCAAACPVICTASVVSSAAPAAAAAVSAAAAAAVRASTVAAPAAVTGISVADADGNCGCEQAGTSFTSWRGRPATTQNGTVRPLGEAETTAVLHTSPTNTSWERRTLRRGAETENGFVAQRTLQQPRRGHASTAALVRIHSFQGRTENNDSCEKSFAAAPAAEPGAVFCDGAGNVDALREQRRIHESAAALSAGTSGEGSALKERTSVGTAATNNAGNTRITADGRPAEGAGNGAAPAAGDGGAFVPAAAPAAAAVGDSAAGPTRADVEEETGHTDAKQVVFYSPGRSPVKGTERGTTFLLLPAEAQQREMSLAQQRDPNVLFALPLQSRAALQQRERDGIGSRTAGFAMTPGHAEQEGATEEPFGPIFCTVASAGGARHSDCGTGVAARGKSLSGQAASVSLSGTVPDSSTVWPASSCQDVGDPQTAQDCVGDDAGLLPVVPGDVSVRAGASLLPRPESRVLDGDLAYLPASEPTAATEMGGTMQAGGAAHAVLDAHAPLGGEDLPGAGASEPEATVKRSLPTSSVVSSSTGGALEPARKGRTNLSGGSLVLGEGRSVVQTFRQRPFHGGGEEGDDWGDGLFAGERTCTVRRGRCQRPASWKRVRQTVGEGHLSYRGCDLIFPSAAHATGLAAHVQRKHFEPHQKWSAQQGEKDERSTKAAADVVEERKRAMRTHEEADGEESLCRSDTVARARLLPQSRLQEVANARVKKKLNGQPDAASRVSASCGTRSMNSGVAPKSVVFHQNDPNISDGYAAQQPLRTGAGQRCPQRQLCGARQQERGVRQCHGLSSASAGDAGRSEQQQNNPSEPLVPSKARPLSAVRCVDPCVACRGTCGSYDREREGNGSAATACPRPSVLPPDEGKEHAHVSFTGRSVLRDVSPDSSASRQQTGRTNTSVKGVGTCTESGKPETGSDFRRESELSSGSREEDSRRRSIGPGEFDRFDEDTSGDESNVSAGEARSRPSQQLLLSQMLSQQHLRAQQSRRAVSAAAECPPHTNLSACVQALWPLRFECSREDVDEDEASRFFKRRRCSLLLWGGIRGDRGHTAMPQASLDAYDHTAHTVTDGRGGAEEKDRNFSGVSTTNALQMGQIEQRQQTVGIPSTIAPHKLFDQRRLKQPSSEEQAAEGSAAEEGTLTEPSANVLFVAPTVTPDAAGGPAGASAAFPPRLLRKRKRGVGASATRLLFLQRPGAGISSEDATLVNSLGSALTFEETQQLRRREQEQRQQEVLRQQEEARRREEAAAARLKEHQKAAAAAIASVGVTALSSGPFVFGSATLAAPSNGSDTSTSAASPEQESGHTATAVDRSSAVNAVVHGVTAFLRAGTAGDSTSARQPIPFSVTREMHSTGQNVEQQQQAKDPSLSGRPKLRIIRSPPSAGDSAVPLASVATDAHGSTSRPCGAAMAVGTSTLSTSDEQKTDVTARSHQQVELPVAFGGGVACVRSSQGEGPASVTQQTLMIGGLLPAEFGGVSIASGASGAGETGMRTFGNMSAFGVTSAGASTFGAGEDVRRLSGGGSLRRVRLRETLIMHGGRVVNRGTPANLLRGLDTLKHHVGGDRLNGSFPRMQKNGVCGFHTGCASVDMHHVKADLPRSTKY